MTPVLTDATGEDVVDWNGMTAYGRALHVHIGHSLEPVIGVVS